MIIFDYSVTVNNQSLGSIKSEISQEKQFDNSLIGLDDGSELGSDDRNVYFDNEIENYKIVDDNENGDSSETIASTLHEELMIKEELSEYIDDLENENLQDANKSVRRQLKRKCNEINYQQGENLPSENKISKTIIQSDEDFENVDDFSAPLNHPDTSKINEDITEINSNHRDKEKLEVDKYINKELKCDSYQKTLSCQEEENIFVNIKKPKTKESGLNYEREEPNVNHGIDELSDSEKSNEFMNCDKISLIENSDFYAEGNCQIPLVGTNFTTTKSGKRIVFHHEGYNYYRTRISKKGTCVFLRLVISFL